MVARTLEDALNASKPIMGDGAAMLENPALYRRLKQAAMKIDPLVDAAAVNAGMPDDPVQVAKNTQKKAENISAGGVNALFNVTKKAANNIDNVTSLPMLQGDGGEEAQQAGVPQQNAGSAKPPRPSAMDQVVGTAESALGYAAFVPLATEMALPALGGVAGWMGMNGMKSALNKPHDMLNSTHITKGLSMRQAMNDGIQVGFSAIQTYGVAKGFNQNMAALKEMYADVTGKDARSISTMQMLTMKDLPPVLDEARQHFIKEYGIRGLTQVVGWGLIARDLMRGKLKDPKEIESGRIGITAGIVPGLVNMGVDMLMGTASTEVYSGFKKAFESGQPIGANEYAAFILATNADLSKRKVGKQVAMEIGAEYANEKAAPGEILRQMSDGRFKNRIEGLIARDEAELAKRHAQKEEQGVQSTTEKQVSMVDRLNGGKQERPKIGKFTSMLNEEGAGLTHGVT